MAKQHTDKRAKRAYKPNPREDRNRSRHQGADIVNLDDARGGTAPQQRIKRVDLTPKNTSQERFIDMLDDENKFIVFAVGPAGCGKTYIATKNAIKALQEKRIDKIVLTRPAVSVDEQHGFLPGSLLEKMAPWVVPFIDVFKEHYTKEQIEDMMEQEIINIVPLAFMRGRTFKNCIVIADEMQNSTPSQAKMVMTRIGENARVIVTGDPQQHDRGFSTNGLSDFVARVQKSAEEKGSTHIGVCHFRQIDIERHPVIEEVLDLYGDEVQ